MKCTIISGPSGSGKTALSKFIAKPFSENEIRVIKGIKAEYDFTQFAKAVQSLLSSQCRMILVEEIPNSSILKSWLRLARQEYLLSSRQAKFIRPEFVLIYQIDVPISNLLQLKDTRNVKLIDLYQDTDLSNSGPDRMHK